MSIYTVSSSSLFLCSLYVHTHLIDFDSIDFLVQFFIHKFFAAPNVWLRCHNSLLSLLCVCFCIGEVQPSWSDKKYFLVFLTASLLATELWRAFLSMLVNSRPNVQTQNKHTVELDRENKKKTLQQTWSSWVEFKFLPLSALIPCCCLLAPNWIWISSPSGQREWVAHIKKSCWKNIFTEPKFVFSLSLFVGECADCWQMNFETALMEQPQMTSIHCYHIACREKEDSRLGVRRWQIYTHLRSIKHIIISSCWYRAKIFRCFFSNFLSHICDVRESQQAECRGYTDSRALGGKEK